MPVIRAVVRLGLLTVALCGLLIAGLTALAGGRNDAFRSFYGSTDTCAPPCFIGIRIGVSTMSEAAALLEAHPWVGDVRQAVNDNALIWRWNGTQPSFVTRYPVDRFIGRVEFKEDVASLLVVVTGIRWGEVIGLYGFPEDRFFMTNVTATAVQLVQSAAYFERGFEIETRTRCPIRRQSAIWYAFATIKMPAQSRAMYDAVPSNWNC
jgi:hypothetical protein